MQKIARIYLRVSSADQDLARQSSIVASAKSAGYYVAGVYREKASGVSTDRPELQRMIVDLQPGDVVIAEKMDRISRLPLPQAEQLINQIRATGARLAIPGVIDLSELAVGTEGITKIVIDAVQDMLLKLALQTSHDDYLLRRERQEQGIFLAKQNGSYEGRKPNLIKHELILKLRAAGETIIATAALVGCSVSQVKRVCALQNDARSRPDIDNP